MMQLHNATLKNDREPAERLLNLTLWDLLDTQAGRCGDAVCVVQPHLSLKTTYAALWQQSAQMARALLAMGVQKGEHIAAFGDGGTQLIALLFAAARIGAPWVVLDERCRRYEAEYLLRQSDACTLVAFGSAQTDRMLGIMLPTLRTDAPGQFRDTSLPRLRNVIHLGSRPLPGTFDRAQIQRLASQAGEDIAAPPGGVQAHDVAGITYTCTPGAPPLGRMLTHYSIVNNARQMGEIMGIGAGDRLCIAQPLCQCAALVQGVIACMAHGAAMVLPAGQQAGAVGAAMRAAGCTALLASTQTCRQVLAEDKDIHSLTAVMVTDEPCPHTLEQAVRHIDVGVLAAAADMGRALPLAGLVSVYNGENARWATRLLPHMQACIADPQTGRRLGAGMEGELLVRGYALMQGCYKMPEETRRLVDEAGWLHTGQLAMTDQKGYVTMVGCAKDRIVRGGESIHPHEIEDFIKTHPAVSRAKVTGVFSRRYGQQIMALVILKHGQHVGEDALLNYARRGLARAKAPRYLRIVESFPAEGEQLYRLFPDLREIAPAHMSLGGAAVMA